MAAAKILGGGTLHHRCPRVTLPTKPYSASFKLLYSTIIHSQPTKIRAFSVEAFFVRACGRVDNDVRKRPINGITMGDVASKDRFKLNQALQALAVDTNGRLQVCDDGVFHKNIALKLLSIKFESLLGKWKMAMTVAFFLMRASFVVLLASPSAVGMSVGFFLAIIMRLLGSPACDVVMKHVDTALNAEFIDGFFSRAFGIGDPNQGIEEKRWKMIGQYIALNGSVVTAEEIAPYLDHETTGKMDDDVYMLPVLHKFDGQPIVDEEGNILYHFPSVHCTPLPRTSSRGKEYAGRWVDRDIQVDKFLEEHQFSKMDNESLDHIVFLLKYNLFCTFLWDIIAVISVTAGVGSYSLHSPRLLKTYAICTVSFMVISFIRMSSIKKRNAEIVKRNEARKKRAKSLESPGLSLKRKLLSARNMAWRASIGNDRIVYGSESDLYEQRDYEWREWDQRFNRASAASIHL